MNNEPSACEFKACWNCKHLVDMFDVCSYACRIHDIDSKLQRSFPFDNTECKEFEVKI